MNNKLGFNNNDMWIHVNWVLLVARTVGSFECLGNILLRHILMIFWHKVVFSTFVFMPNRWLLWKSNVLWDFFFLFFPVLSILIFDFLHLEDIELISDNLKSHYTSQVLIMWLPHASFSLSKIRKLYSVGLVQMKLFWIQHF